MNIPIGLAVIMVSVGFTVNSFTAQDITITAARRSTYRKEMETTARLILDYELMFWDTIFQYLIKT
jgi:hypothetical protein